jgi:hypothetical protein
VEKNQPGREPRADQSVELEVNMNDLTRAATTTPTGHDEQRLRSEILRDPALSDAIKAEQAREKLRRIVPNIWSFRPQPVDWVLRDIAARRAVTMIAGPSGSRKTWFGLQLAKAITHGGEMLGRRVTRPGDVLYIDRENPLSAIRDRLDLLDFQQTPRFFHWGLHCQPIPPTVDHSGAYIEIAKLFPTAPSLIFDTYIRFHTAESENDASAMAAVAAQFRTIAEAGPAVVLFHHQGKNGASFRGSSEIQAGVDIFLTLSERDGALHLETIKNRLGEPISLTLAFDLEEDDGFTATTDPVSEKRQRELQIVRDFIGRNPGLIKTQIEKQLVGQLGRKTIRKLLEHGLDQGSWVKKDGPNNSTMFYPAGWLLEDTFCLSGCFSNAR